MGLDDKLNAAATSHVGAAKESVGKLTGNERLKREGQHDQAQAKVQEAGEKVKDAAKDIGTNLKEATAKVKQSFSKE